MAIVSLGVESLRVGQGEIFFNSFEANRRQAYCIFAVVTLSQPSNIFSNLVFRSYFENTNYGQIKIDNDKEFSILPITFTYLVPLSRLYGNNGTLSISVERQSVFSGGGSAESDLTLELQYDDDESVRSWLD